MPNPLVSFGATSLVGSGHFADAPGVVGLIEACCFVDTHSQSAYRETLVAARRCSGLHGKNRRSAPGSVLVAKRHCCDHFGFAHRR